MPDLSLKVDRNDIVVSKPSVGLSITYRKQGRISIEPLPIDPNGEELIFLVRKKPCEASRVRAEMALQRNGIHQFQ